MVLRALLPVGDWMMKITDRVVHVAACEYLGVQHDYDIPSGNIKDMRKALEAAIQAAWISVDERLPEPVYVDGIESYKEYLVCDTLNKKVSHDYFHSSHGWNHYCGYVTHWMPLPEYKGE
jgi:hypothetical protein